MRLLRSLSLMLAGLLLVLPVIGHDDRGGGGGGESGVWILPRSSYIGNNGGAGIISTPPRATRPHSDLSRDLQMEMSSEMQSPVAVLMDPQTNVSVQLPVDGKVVTVPGVMLQTYVAAGLTQVYGTLVDGQGRGYVLRVTFDLSQRSAAISIY